MPLDRDVLLMAVPDEEVGGELGAKWMREQPLRRARSASTSSTKAASAAATCSRPGKLVFGISVAEKKIMWLKLRAEGVAGHGSQPHDQNPNDRLIRALARLLARAAADRRRSASLDDDEVAHRRRWPRTSSTTPSSIRRSRSPASGPGVGDPPKVNVIPSVAEATLDCRVLPGTTQGAVARGDPARASAIRRSRSTIINEGDDPVVTTQDSPFYRALEAAMKRHHPDAIVTPMVVPYGTDAQRLPPARA